ncbi:hypothetical protein A3218_24600 [Pseudomonas chlororaphis]|nr:hypothetical protein A3218_24600 [Pseudomonas chlororaphis]
MQKTRSLFWTTLISTLLLSINSAKASLDIDGTRLIYYEKDKEANISIINRNPETTLVQVYIDSQHEGAAIPFAVITPLVKLAPHERKTIRILYEGRGLPEDRESYFSLNFVEVPIKPGAADTLQLAIRHELKFFYRPYFMKNQPLETASALIWELAGKHQINVKNPTKLHKSLIDIKATMKGQPRVLADYLFIAPGATESIEIPEDYKESQIKIDFLEINDTGFKINYDTDIRQ